MSYTIDGGYGKGALHKVPASAMNDLMKYVEHLEKIIIGKALDQYLPSPCLDDQIGE